MSNISKTADSLAFANQSLAVFAINCGVLPEAGKFFRWKKRTINISGRVVYLTGGESGKVAATRDVMGPLLYPRASPDTAGREVTRCLKDAERDFADCGFWFFGFKRGEIQLFDFDGRRTNDRAKADPRATIYIPTEYWLTPEGVDFLRNVQACALEIDLFKFNVAGRNKALRDIIEAYFTNRVDAEGNRLYLPITPDKSSKPKPEKAEAEATAKAAIEGDGESEGGALTVSRVLHDLQRMPRGEQIEFHLDYLESAGSHLIADSQDYAEGEYILSKERVVMDIHKHSLETLRQRIAKYNSKHNGRPAKEADAQAAVLDTLRADVAVMLARAEHAIKTAAEAGATYDRHQAFFTKAAQSLRGYLSWAEDGTAESVASAKGKH